MDIKWNIEWVKLFVTSATAILAAGWAILKWTGQRKSDRLVEEKRIAALYVNPFRFASEDLQSRLYNILCKDGLSALRQRDDREKNNGSSYHHTYEMLYKIAEYFAYEPFVLRYTQYGTDPRVVDLIEKIRDDFATDRGYLDPWCIFRPRQRALGELVLADRQAEQAANVSTIPLLDFEVKVDKKLKSLYLEQAVAKMNEAAGVGDLEKRTQLRLAEVQSHLVELLDYLEHELRKLRKRQPIKEALSPFSSRDKRPKRKRAYNDRCSKCRDSKTEALSPKAKCGRLSLHNEHSR